MAGSKAQKFGGPWSLFKLKTVQGYLKVFTTALSSRFILIYIDAFAGSGSFQFGDERSGFLDLLPEVHIGSAQRALEIRPPFNEFHFVELSSENMASLASLCGDRPDVTLWKYDANEAVRKICERTGWESRRGVIFLDPFGTSVEWSTLETIAKTKALDVWYLAPLAGLYRNMPRRHEKLTPEKRRTVTRILGTADWEGDFYRLGAKGFFGEPKSIRKANVAEIQAYLLARLRLVFPYVEEPVPIYNKRNSPMFSLVFAMSNPSQAAREVAMPIAKHLLKQPMRR